jgi:hypothetical protein
MKTKRRVTNNNDKWYDFYDDWDLIEASIAQQYGIRIRQEIKTIRWKEVKTLIVGLLPDTPLGKIVSIRSENNKDILKQFTPEMRRIRNDWLRRQTKEKFKDEKVLDQIFIDMDKQLRRMFMDK